MNLNNFNKLLFKKAGLLKCIFLTLFFQVFVTGIVVFYLNNREKDLLKILRNQNFFLIFFLILAINIGLITFMIIGNISFEMRFMIFILFSIIQGALLSLSTRFLSKEVIYAAIVSTCCIFLSFLFAGFIITSMKINLSWLGILLFFSLLGLLITQIVTAFTQTTKKTHRLITTFGLLIFSLYVLYDTNKILIKYQNTGIDCIRGSLDYYLDIINIFLFSTRD